MRPADQPWSSVGGGLEEGVQQTLPLQLLVGLDPAAVRPCTPRTVWQGRVGVVEMKKMRYPDGS